MTIEEPILRDFQRLLRRFEASIADFECALDGLTDTSDLRRMFPKYSKMGVDSSVAAATDAMLNRNSRAGSGQPGSDSGTHCSSLPGAVGAVLARGLDAVALTPNEVVR